MRKERKLITSQIIFYQIFSAIIFLSSTLLIYLFIFKFSIIDIQNKTNYTLYEILSLDRVSLYNPALIGFLYLGLSISVFFLGIISFLSIPLIKIKTEPLLIYLSAFQLLYIGLVILLMLFDAVFSITITSTESYKWYALIFEWFSILFVNLGKLFSDLFFFFFDLFKIIIPVSVFILMDRLLFNSLNIRAKKVINIQKRFQQNNTTLLSKIVKSKSLFNFFQGVILFFLLFTIIHINIYSSDETYLKNDSNYLIVIEIITGLSIIIHYIINLFRNQKKGLSFVINEFTLNIVRFNLISIIIVGLYLFLFHDFYFLKDVNLKVFLFVFFALIYSYASFKRNEEPENIVNSNKQYLYKPYYLFIDLIISLIFFFGINYYEINLFGLLYIIPIIYLLSIILQYTLILKMNTLGVNEFVNALKIFIIVGVFIAELVLNIKGYLWTSIIFYLILLILIINAYFSLLLTKTHEKGNGDSYLIFGNEKF